MVGKAQKIGQIGEKAARLYLKQNGFEVINLNYRRPWGEIDIVAAKNGIWYFCEIKTTVAGRSGNEPIESLTHHQLKRLRRVIDSYLEDQGVGPEAEWQVAAVLVTLSADWKPSRIDWLDDVL